MNNERVLVRIPPGVKNGSRLRLKEKEIFNQGRGDAGTFLI